MSPEGVFMIGHSLTTPVSGSDPKPIKTNGETLGDTAGPAD